MEQKGEGSAKQRGWMVWARRVALGAAAVVVLWVGENALHREAPPAPPFREADLPALPPAVSNGWVDFEAKNPPTASIPTDLAWLCAPPTEGGAPRTWAEVIAKQQAIATFLATADAQRDVAALEAGLAKPAFADACPLDFDTRCHWFALFRAHQAEELAILQRALGAHHAEALRAAARLVRADASLLASFRSFLAQTTVIAGAERTLTVLDLLLGGHAAAEPIDPTVVRELGEALDAIHAEAIDLRRSVTAEYVLGARAVEMVAADHGGLPPSLFLDRGQTLRLIGEHLAPLAAFAADPSAPPPPDPRPLTTGALWWLHNPVGKRLVDSTRVSARSLLEKAHRQRESILRRRDALRKRLPAP